MSNQEVQPAYSGGKKALAIAAGVLTLAGGLVACQEPPAPAESATPVRAPVVLEPTVVPVEPFVLNLADPEGDRYFRLTLQLVLDQRAVAERAAVGLAQAKLRDRIFALLSKKRVAQVTTVAGKELLRDELRETTEPLFATPPFHDPEHDPAPAHVLDVLFTEFLVQ